MEFVTEVLAWYKEKAEGLGRVRIGDVILREGADSLLAQLKTKFLEFTPEGIVAHSGLKEGTVIPYGVLDAQWARMGRLAIVVAPADGDAK